VAEEVLSRAGSLADVIVGNDEEFGFMAGGIDKGLARRAIWPVPALQSWSTRWGEKGAITFATARKSAPASIRSTRSSPTGAGDSFMAGLLASLSEGRDIRDAVLRGSACAAIVVSRPGCAPAMPDTEQLEAFLTSHPGPTPV
jgi:5-dehydro-2-deoxygluconokinase